MERINMESHKCCSFINQLDDLEKTICYAVKKLIV